MYYTVYPTMYMTVALTSDIRRQACSGSQRTHRRWHQLLLLPDRARSSSVRLFSTVNVRTANSLITLQVFVSDRRSEVLFAHF